MKVLCKKDYYEKELDYNDTDDFLKNPRNEDYEILVFKKDNWYAYTIEEFKPYANPIFDDNSHYIVISDVPAYRFMWMYNSYVRDGDMHSAIFYMERLVYNDIFNLPLDYACENDYFADYFYTENDLRKEKIKRLGGKIVGS
jgi:hypothetical protein